MLNWILNRIQFAAGTTKALESITVEAATATLYDPIEGIALLYVSIIICPHTDVLGRTANGFCG